jgi:uncharacterized protein YjbJ (UPF0337 family)
LAARRRGNTPATSDQEDDMGEWKDKAEGTLKEKEGELTDDPMREKQGEGQKEMGNAKGKLEDAKDEIKERL